MNPDHSAAVLKRSAARAKPMFVMTGALVLPFVVAPAFALLWGGLGVLLALVTGVAFGVLVGWFIGETVELHFRALAEILSRAGTPRDPTDEAGK